MMPKGEGEATSLSASNIVTSDQNGGGGGESEVFNATEFADEIGDVVVPRSNGERANSPLQDDDLAVALKDDRGEQEEKEHIIGGENATAVAAATRQEQQVRITIYRCWAWTTCYGFLPPFVAQLPITYFG